MPEERHQSVRYPEEGIWLSLCSKRPGEKPRFQESQIGRNGRGERIRTSDPLVPNQVRYQTALRPESAAVRCR
jgi:hypothetical protein